MIILSDKATKYVPTVTIFTHRTTTGNITATGVLENRLDKNFETILQLQISNYITQLPVSVHISITIKSFERVRHSTCT
jgi:hypothetical protein